MTAALKRVAMSSHGSEAIPRSGTGGLKANEIVKRGWLCGYNASGYLVAFTAIATLISAGLAEADGDATGLSDGDVDLLVRQGVVDLVIGSAGDALVDADAPCAAYGMDNQTVGKGEGGATPRSIAGLFLGVNADTGKARVLVGPVGYALAKAFALGAGQRIQKGTVTLVAGVGTVATGITITAASKIVTTLNTPAGTLGTWGYKVADADLVVGAPGTGAFSVRAIDENKAAATSDTSTVNYIIVG